MVGRGICCAVGGVEDGGADRVELSFRMLGETRGGARYKVVSALSLEAGKLRLSIMMATQEDCSWGVSSPVVELCRFTNRAVLGCSSLARTPPSTGDKMQPRAGQRELMILVETNITSKDQNSKKFRCPGEGIL